MQISITERTLIITFIVLIGVYGCASPESSDQSTPEITFQPAEFNQIVNDENSVVKRVDYWNIPFETGRSRDPYAAGDGTVYFAGQQGDYVGVLNPATNEAGYFPLPEGAGPHTVVVAQDQSLWYAGNRNRTIGKVDRLSGEITDFPMENDFARDPHTFAFDRNGNLWFTAQGGNGVGFFNRSTGETTVFEVPTPGARPYAIRMDPSGLRPWIAMNGAPKIATVDPETMELKEITLLRESIRIRRLDVTSDGNVWYGDFSSGYIGRYNPEDGSIREWEVPTGPTSRIYAVLKDDKDRLWVSTTGMSPNKLIGFDTKSLTFVAEQELEFAAGAIRHMMYDVSTRSMWFGTDTGYIARLVLD